MFQGIGVGAALVVGGGIAGYGVVAAPNRHSDIATAGIAASVGGGLALTEHGTRHYLRRSLDPMGVAGWIGEAEMRALRANSRNMAMAGIGLAAAGTAAALVSRTGTSPDTRGLVRNGTIGGGAVLVAGGTFGYFSKKGAHEAAAIMGTQVQRAGMTLSRNIALAGVGLVAGGAAAALWTSRHEAKL